MVAVLGALIMSKWTKVACAVAGLALVSVLAASAPVAASGSTQKHDFSHGLWLVTTRGESFTGAVRQAAESRGGGQVKFYVEAMLKRAEAGARCLRAARRVPRCDLRPCDSSRVASRSFCGP